MPMDIEHLRSWIGHSETLTDHVTAVPPQALSATLDRDDAPVQHGDILPPCWHWLYFLPVHRQSEIGPDGHPRRGGFLPPIPLPRRMWAGSQLQFHAPLRIGQDVQRTSRILDVRLKDGRTGPLVFVNVAHEVRVQGQLAITEQHDIVYREMPAPDAASPQAPQAPVEAQWSRRIVPDPVQLFRYSALTFNGHRIHYDRRYTMDVERYPGLVVHGPLTAMLLLDLIRRELPQAVVRSFSFRAVSPLFDDAPFLVCGRRGDAGAVHLWACAEDGRLAMEASATLD